AELVRLKADLLFTIGTQAALAAKGATKTIPIVFAAVGDPVGTGVVASLARPGGNATGVANVFVDISAKLLEVLKEAVPTVTRAAVIAVMSNPAMQLGVKEAEIAGRKLGVRLQVHDLRDPGGFDGVFTTIGRERPGALLVFPDNLMFANRSRIVDFASRQRLPAMYPARDFAEAGGLMSFGANFPDVYRRAAAYVDKIFKGAKPADLPVEQPTRFELVINMKTAKGMGLTIPPAVLIRADQVIQ
ncbi:MAG TPA: ABC transporter substrate-binding protein, partial [Candidatus Methylomirabilis sp.]